MTGILRTIAFVSVAMLLATACAGSNNDVPANASPSPEATPIGQPKAQGKPPKCDENLTTIDTPAQYEDTSVKPEIPKGEGNAPCKLIIKDIKVGEGAEAKLNDQVTVQYAGSIWADGKQFDSSWDRKDQPAPTFPLTPGGLIEGWTDGLPGMKVGGRRLLVIPWEKAYGPAGRPPIPPYATLVFVIDLTAVTAGQQAPQEAPQQGQ